MVAAMRRKPPNLIYDVDERPGAGTLFLLGLQHICLLAIAFIFPVLVVDAMGGPPEDARNLITMAMVATGIATVLQGLNRGPVGSGYLCPTLNGPAFLSASLLAGKAGGLPLIFGMTLAAGLFEGLFSRVVTRLRALFPAEVTGTIVTMVGVEVIPFAVKRFFGVDSTHAALDPVAFTVAALTLFTMMGLTVWGKGTLRLYSVLVGVAVGYAAAFATGQLHGAHFQQIAQTPLFHVPSFGAYGLAFDWGLLVPFMVASLSSALKTMGDLTTCQKINDAQWKRPDMPNIACGILACASGNVISGLTGALGQSPSSSNVGLCIATGATSRTIAYAIGVLLITLAFFPKLAAIFVIMPTPVMGATLVFSASFMIIAGIQIMLSRMLDARKTFVIGTSMVFGLSVEFLPGLYRDIHPWLQPFFQSSLSLATLCAILLNLFLRLGISRTARLQLTPGVDGSEQIFAFMERQGGLWGAMRDVIQRAGTATNEVLESVTGAGLAQGPLQVSLSFDEFNLEVHIEYPGTPMTFPASPPTERELMEGPDGFLRLSGFLTRTYADRVKAEAQDGVARIRLHFDH